MRRLIPATVVLVLALFVLASIALAQPAAPPSDNDFVAAQATATATAEAMETATPAAAATATPAAGAQATATPTTTAPGTLPTTGGTGAASPLLSLSLLALGVLLIVGVFALRPRTR